jgi:ubiquinone/menaquinone biosynthesis C-methylase UbiE
MTFVDSKQRFSNRVADYIRYRPAYPSALVDLLRKECALLPDRVIADVGSGTGLLSKLFLEHGYSVYGVEPNDEMRAGGEEVLRSYRNFTSVNGSAEATTLDDSSVDLVTAGQAFHWFDPHAARHEFQRILKPCGFLVVVWNDRRISESHFSREYEDLLLRYGTDYTRVKETYPGAAVMQRFFAGNRFHSRELANFQEFDFAGLSGRLRSSSYAPQEGHANYRPMMAELERLFGANQVNGRVRMNYTTQIYFGNLETLGNSR